MCLCMLALVVNSHQCFRVVFRQAKATHTGFSRAEGGSLAANETTNAHSLLFPPLPALLSSTTPSPLLSFPLLSSPLCLSLTPAAHTLLCWVWGDGWLQLSLSHPTNIELHWLYRGREQKKPYLPDRGCMNSFKVSQQLEKWSICPPLHPHLSSVKWSRHFWHPQGVCTALSRAGMVMRSVCVCVCVCARARARVWAEGVCILKNIKMQIREKVNEAFNGWIGHWLKFRFWV